MTNMRKLIPGLLFCLSLLLTGGTWAADKQLRIATLAPKNSQYHRQLMELGEVWRTAQGGNAKYLIYTDGSQGGETELARRMRIGQLQGALLSVVGLKELEPSISALQNIPLLFKSWEEVDYVREKLRVGIEKKFFDKGFVILAWADAGWVKFFSKEPGIRPDDYKKMKFFVWSPELEQQAIMKSLGYTPVPLETNDILPSLQTGMVNVVPTTPYFALASQLYDTAPNMLDINWAPIIGAVVITKKAWEEMTPPMQETLRQASEKTGVQMRAKARQEVEDSIDAMKKRGLVIHRPNPEQMREWDALANTLYQRIRGTTMPAETFDEVFLHLKNFRSGKGK